MKVIRTSLDGLIIIEPAVFSDNRGYFFEAHNQRTFRELGINIIFVQDNQSMSKRGVIRGLHFQVPPFEQTKLVRVLQGTVLDVAVDLRRNSATYGQHHLIELSAENRKQLLVPRGFAHGYSVLSEQAVVFYKCDQFHHQQSERGINFADPELSIAWQVDKSQAILSAKDRILPMMADYLNTL